MIELFTFEHGLLMKFNKKRLFLPLRNKMFFRALMALCLVTSFLTGKCQDFSLDHFLKIGINNSPLIRDLNGQIRSNSVDSLLVIALSKPRVDFRGYAFYAPLINHFGYSEVLTNIANLTSVMSVSQQVFNKKTVRASLLKTNIQRQSISNTILLTENSLKKTDRKSVV